MGFVRYRGRLGVFGRFGSLGKGLGLILRVVGVREMRGRGELWFSL